MNAVHELADIMCVDFHVQLPVVLVVYCIPLVWPRQMHRNLFFRNLYYKNMGFEDVSDSIKDRVPLYNICNPYILRFGHLGHLTVAQLVERQTVDDTLNSYLLVTGSIPVGEIFCFFGLVFF